MLTRLARWVSAGIVGIVAALPFAAYIPWVQNKAADIAADYASKKTGKDISVGDVRVRFPLDVSATDIQVIDENGDTLFKADEVKGNVKPGPLQDKKVEVDNVSLKGAKSQIKTEDGSTDLDVDLDEAKVDKAAVDLNNNQVDMGNASLKGGKAKMSYKPEKKKPEPDKEPSKPWKVNADKVTADDVDFKMDMKPTIDKLDAKVGHAEASDVKVDTGEQTVDVGELDVEKAEVNYEHPSEKDAKQYSKDHPMPKETKKVDGSNDKPWKVKAGKVRVKDSKGRYSQTGKKPNKPGTTLDPDNIEVEDVNAEVDNFEMDGDNIKVPVKHLSGKERSGLQVKDASGTVSKDKNGLDLNDVKLKTRGSDIKLDAHVDQDMLDGKPNGKASIDTDSKIDLNEVEKLVPEARKALKDVPHNKPVKIKAKARGNDKRVDIHSLDADVPGLGRVKGKGTIYNPTDMDRMKADLDTEVDLRDPSALNKMLGLDGVKLPPMKMSGKVNKEGCKWVARNLRVTTGGGTLHGDGYYDVCNENYDVDATFNNFPVKSFLPQYDVSNLTASVNARGHGFDFSDCGDTWTDATVNLAGVRYDGKHYGGIKARGKLRGGYADLYASSHNRGADMDVNAHGTICDDHYVFTADGNVRDLDLQHLGVTDGICNGKTKLRAQGDINLRTQRWDADLVLRDIDWQLDSSMLVADDAHAVLHSTPHITCIMLESEDNYAHLNSPMGMMPLAEKFKHTAAEFQRQYKERWLDVERLKEPMPYFDFDMHMGTDGLVQRYLQQKEMDFRDISCEISRDSSIYIDGRAHGISYGETNIDTITIHANELNNKYLAFNAHMGNRPGTWDEFATVDVEGGLKGPAVDFMFHQQNIKHETGYRLGCNARLEEDEIKMRLFGKDNMVVGYRNWTFNEDNYVNVDYRTRMLDANLSLMSDSSSVKLLTTRLPGENTENVQLDIDNLRLEEWTRIVPMLDNTSGTLNANVDINWDGANADGDGVIDIKDFVYNGKPEGDVTLNADFDFDQATAATTLTADLILDGRQSIALRGSLNDATAATPLNLEARFERFPLSRANAFIPGDYIWLDGYALGTLAVSGSMDNPKVHGFFTADSATVNLPRYGSSLKFASDRIPIDDNVITFNNYNLIGTNRSPVTLNGTVDLRDLDNMIIDLRADGREVQFMDSKQDEVTQIFGKGLADINATVKGRGNFMSVRADATLLAGSNITYVMKDDISQLSKSIDEDMVTFTDFKHPAATAILVTGKGSSATNILANIAVEQGAKINAYLSEDGQNRATIDGSGRLKYTLDFAGKDNLTGTYTIASGNLRYTPPMISQKNFNITPGSTITWTGDMLNPQLDLNGTERLKASARDQKDPVDFVIEAHVGGTLSAIDLKFDLNSENNPYVQNDLQTMGEHKRSERAINLLLTNTYMNPNESGNNVFTASANSALFSFLQSKLNAWAAQTLPGIDLSFGINQYVGARGTGTETSYSYRLAKSLFNDRFRIVVGGEYNPTAAQEEDIASNLFNEVSLEYYLNDVGSRYFKLFRHMSYKNVMEDKVAETGVAYVLKRKLTNLKNLFTFKHSREYLLRDSLEKARKAELKMQENAIDAISESVEDSRTFTVPLDSEDVNKPVVTRKKDDESNE